MIVATCSSCGKAYNYADEHAGQSAACPNCKATIEIPYPEAIVEPVEPGPTPAAAAPAASDHDPAPLTKMSGMAIAALICSALGFCIPPLGIVGLVLGIMAINRIDNPANRVRGRGLATAAAILGGISLVIGTILVLIALLLPALGAARRTARQMQNGTQVRGIHQGDILYASVNNQWYPGVNSDGDVLDPSAGGRFKVLLDGNYITPSYLVNPAETGAISPWVSGPLTPQHFSYTAEDISAPGARHDEWRDNTNPQMPAHSDRNTGSPAAPQSVWTTKAGEWRGSVTLGDNSTIFSTTSTLSTKFVAEGGAVYNRTNDALFEAVGPHDAWMIYDER
jgi:hypothetical protein